MSQDDCTTVTSKSENFSASCRVPVSLGSILCASLPCPKLQRLGNPPGEDQHIGGWLCSVDTKDLAELIEIRNSSSNEAVVMLRSISNETPNIYL